MYLKAPAFTKAERPRDLPEVTLAGGTGPVNLPGCSPEQADCLEDWGSQSRGCDATGPARSQPPHSLFPAADKSWGWAAQ